MKNFFFTILLLSFCISKMSAQSKFYLKTGVNLSNTIVKNELLNDSSLPLSISPFVGIDFEFPLSTVFNGNIGVQYLEKGSFTIFHLTDCAVGESIYFGKVNYLDFLPTASYKLSQRFSLFVGANIGIKLKEKYQETPMQAPGPKTATSANLKAIRTSDIGYIVGFRLKKGKINFDFQINQSLLSILKDVYQTSDVYSLKNTKLYNQTLQFGLSYYLEPKKK